MSMSQKASVFAAVCTVLGKNEFAEAVELTKEQRKTVVDMVTSDLVSGAAEFSSEAKAKYPTKDDVKGYVVGMVSNWLRKDTRLNGNTKYEAKNPGSRTGQGDEVLKNLKALRATLKDKEHQELVDAEIKKRQDEIAAKKAKSVVLDLSKIPDDVKRRLGLIKDEVVETVEKTDDELMAELEAEAERQASDEQAS